MIILIIDYFLDKFICLHVYSLYNNRGLIHIGEYGTLVFFSFMFKKGPVLRIEQHYLHYLDYLNCPSWATVET